MHDISIYSGAQMCPQSEDYEICHVDPLILT